MEAQIIEPPIEAWPLRRKAEAVLGYTYRGLHHLPGGERAIRDLHNGRVVVASVYDGLSTFDSDELTRLVAASHFYCVRAEVRQGGPRRVSIWFHNRPSREGGFADRHPTLAYAFEQHNSALKAREQ